MFMKKFQSEPFQPIRLKRVQLVRTAHFMSQLKEQSCDSAHSAAGDAGAREGEISRAVNFFHAMMKRRDVGGDSFPSIIFRYESFVARAGKMNNLKCRVAQEWQRFDDRLIDAARALTSAHHQHCRC